jgi:hypothetical protein
MLARLLVLAKISHVEWSYGELWKDRVVLLTFRLVLVVLLFKQETGQFKAMWQILK